jgi:lipopolysaccharide export system permease protein
MLTILDRQMIYSYVKAYVFCLISLLGLFVVVDLFMNLEDFTAQRKDFRAVLEFVGVYYGYKSFQIFDKLCESVVLLAGMFTVAWMQRNNELLPLLSAGVSTRRVVRPVLFSAGAMMVFASVNQEIGLPNIDNFMLENRQNPDGAKETTDIKGTYDKNAIFISGASVVRRDRLVKQFMVLIPPQLGRSVVIQADEAEYKPQDGDDKRSGGWLIKNAKQKSVDWPKERDDILQQLGNGNYFLKSDVDLETLTRVKNWHMYLPTWRILKELDRPSNPQHASLAVAFHMRLTRILTGLTLIVLGLSVILRDQNRNVFISAGMCLILCVVFFLSIFACQFLGKDDYLSPALAAWLPVVAFGPLALVMFDAVHT